jgi:S1-C subfamily serine protease
MLSQLTETGKASRAYLGVYSVEITPEVAKSYNLPVTAGAYLYSSSSYSAIVSNTPASKAGLKDKDIVTAVNGVKVGAAGSLSSLIGEYKVGDTVQLTVLRDGKEIAINVTLEGYKN